MLADLEKENVQAPILVDIKNPFPRAEVETAGLRYQSL